MTIGGQNIACANPFTAQIAAMAGTHPATAGIAALQAAVTSIAAKTSLRGSSRSASSPVTNWPDP